MLFHRLIAFAAASRWSWRAAKERTGTSCFTNPSWPTRKSAISPAETWWKSSCAAFIAGRSGWPRRRASRPIWCFVRKFTTIAGWIIATRENSSPWAAKPPSSTSKKSNRWWPERRRTMSQNLLQNQWQRLTEPAIRRLQAEQLRRYLRTVVLPFSAHYRKLFQEHALDVNSFHTLEDLQRLPFTTKSDLLNT